MEDVRYQLTDMGGKHLLTNHVSITSYACRVDAGNTAPNLRPSFGQGNQVQQCTFSFLLVFVPLQFLGRKDSSLGAPPRGAC